MKFAKLLLLALSTVWLVSTASAQVSLDLTGMTSTTMTFTLTGNLSGTLTTNEHILAFEDINNADWLSGPSAENVNPAASYFSSDPMSASNSISSLLLHNDSSIVEDRLTIAYDGNFTAADFGTGVSVTLTMPSGWSFNPENVTQIALSWGNEDTSAEPTTGVFQSSSSLSAVPEPSTYAVIIGVVALAAAGLVRRQRRTQNNAAHATS